MEITRSKNNVPIRFFNKAKETDRKEEEIMATKVIEQVIQIAPTLLDIPFGRVWSSYDQEADVLYVNFKKPAYADDSELTEDDTIVRYEKGEAIGFTFLHASKRFKKPQRI